MLSIPRIDTRKQDVKIALAELRAKLSPRGDIVSEAGRQRTIEVFGQPLLPSQVVERICGDVRGQGLDAVLDYTFKLDGADLTRETVRVSDDEIAVAHQKADPEFLKTVRRIRDNIREFQSSIKHCDVNVSPREGVTLQQRYLPLARAGLCVPGGAAAYPSTVLMTAVPAQTAGVKELVVVAPPTDFGANNPDILATCHELGITEIYRIGGAQAVAAMAFGADPIRPVDKIVGPGNLFVALAKKLVYGEVDIDSIAGPSEVVVIADSTAKPEFVAADMLAQAEHAPGSSVLVTWDESLFDAIEEELNKQLSTLSRRDLTIPSLQDFSALILVSDAQEACHVTDLLAPEHLHISTENPRDQLAKINNAGATFLGHYTPVALGDYIAGPSHVLPTGGTARWASGLCVNDFLRSGSVIEYSQAALQAEADDLGRVANKEALTAHKASVDIRR